MFVWRNIFLCLAVLILGGCQSSEKIPSNPYDLDIDDIVIIDIVDQIATININNYTFVLSVASTSAERAKGLMHVNDLQIGEGMLFVFDEKDYHDFWMKNTFSSLLIIWLDQSQIVDMQIASPCLSDPCKKYHPRVPADMVIELAIPSAP